MSGDTFAAVLGGGQSSMEALLLKRRIKGPTWLRLVKPKAASPQVRCTSCLFATLPWRGVVSSLR